VPERPFHNIFYSFRGPSQRSEHEVDVQLEDNATKALVNVLELSTERASLTRSFVELLASIPVGSGASPSFFLQGGPAELTAPKRHLLGISMTGELPQPAPADPSGDGRVDACIHFPDDVLLAIEAKVGAAELDYAQMARHAQRWGITTPSAWRTASWADVHGWVGSRRPAADAVTRFLLDQFLEFLDVAGLTPFMGFRDEDFDFFASDVTTRNPRQRGRIRTRLAACWEAVGRELGQELYTQIGPIHVQSIKPHENAAAAATPTHPRGVNLTIELWATEVQLNQDGWNDHQQATLLRWLRSDAATGWFDSHRDFQLVGFRRYPTAHGPDGRPVWRSQGEQQLPDPIPAATFGTKSLEALIARVPPGDKLGLHVRLAWPRADALRLGASIVKPMAQGVQALAPLVEEINGLQGAA
jgi:hypothetical protein